MLEALRTQSRKADQSLLVNDRSTDASVEIAKKHSFEICETTPDQFGLAAGRNVALAHAKGDVLVGCDADVSLAAEAALSLEHPTPTRESTRMKAALILRDKITPALLCRTDSKTTSFILRGVRAIYHLPGLFACAFLRACGAAWGGPAKQVECCRYRELPSAQRSLSGS